MVKKNTCVFISGQGSNLKNLILRSRDNSFPIKIGLIVTNNKDAFGIVYAKKNSIPYVIVNTKIRFYENQLLRILKKNKISLICLAGYMKIVSKDFIKSLNGSIIKLNRSNIIKDTHISECEINIIDKTIQVTIIVNVFKLSFLFNLSFININTKTNKKYEINLYFTNSLKKLKL